MCKYRIFLLIVFTAIVATEDEGNLAPVITEHPIDVVVSRGSPATLNCAAKPATSKITWFKDGQPVTTNKELVNSHRIVLDTGALFLLKVNSGKNGRDSDAGSYYCVASNEHGEVKSNEGSLKLAMLRDVFLVTPRTSTALSGNQAKLECSPPKGFPEPVVSWRKDDKELKIQDNPRYTLHPDGNLIIEPVNHSDSGTFQCVATNMVGERVSLPARLSVYEKPRFLQEPKDMTVDVGASVLFDCRVTGEPQPQITWKRKNNLMPAARAYIAKDNRGLRIDKVVPEDEGEYICYARNPAGQLEASAHLRVQAPPSFQTKPVDQSVPAGTTATFECVLIGQPSPAYFWSKEGQQDLLFPSYVSADGRTKVSTSGTLTIEDVRQVDEGAYVCAGMNSAGSSLSKATLKVTTKAVTGNTPAKPPPTIEYGHQNQTLMVGASALMPCQASGKPSPRILWFRDGSPIDTSDSRISQHSTGSLHIADLKKTDTGVYTCSAKNDDGESTWSASLTVEDHTKSLPSIRMPDPSNFPTAPSQPIIVNVTDTEVELRWNAPSNTGTGQIAGYIIQFYSPDLGQTWFNIPDYVSTTSHRIKGLKPSHSYMFLIRAENEKGMGPPSTPSALVTTSKSSDSAISEQNKVDMSIAIRRLTSEQLIKLEEVKTINSTAVRLFWKRKKIEDLVDGYYIKWRGPPRANDHQFVNVTSASTESYVVANLMPFTNYEFFVIPYHSAAYSVQGAPSNSMDALTAEAPPSLPPQDVHIRMLNLTTLRVSWRAPKADGINGILKGFQVIIIGQAPGQNRNISTTDRAASITLFHLEAGMKYKIRVAARSNGGIGVPFSTNEFIMNQETLEKHLAAQRETESFLYGLVNRSNVPLIIIIALILILVIVVVAYCYWRNSRHVDGKDRSFIKINDGSVHMTANNLWDAPPPHVGNPMYNTTGRLTLNNRNGQALYSLTPNAHDFYNACDDYGGTMNRPGSDHHYHYAQLTGGPGNPMSTFYGNQYHDDPSPYATTTLILSNQQPAWLNDKMLRGPAIPSNPVPPGPPARYADHTTGRRSRSSRTSDGRATLNGPIHHTSSSQRSDSPPHTDVSYVQLHSTDGTGGSNRRTPPKQTLMDFIPPPPANPPPPGGIYDSATRRHLNRGSTPREETYDSVSDAAFAVNARPTSRNRNTGLRHKSSSKREDDDSQRSSLMMDDEGGSSEADGENSEGDAPKRKAVPRMGVSASGLSHGCYDTGRTQQRFRSMQRGVPQEQN
ncbi:unnamed protein product [Caenorhabditis angaria]|uniref:Uncharacterized protein n=1 Tax=Caenorhabditis angaria TaxID=860376 RepID=A0A9P1J2P9_9PELO|nr:unnamed protein product [Caenorhabditis angaria]